MWPTPGWPWPTREGLTLLSQSETPHLSGAVIGRITRRGVKEIISQEEFVRMLQAGNPLRLKMGFDPSRPDIHLGHVVGLRKLRQLQELGHQVILIVGDWTAQIGDPSGQSATRPMLTHEEVVANAQSYLRQFFKVVDRDRTQVVWQSEWFGKFTLADVIRLTSKFTLAQFLERDDFAQRFKEHRPIALTELLYPLLQAYDSVAIRSDVEFGGSDQKFNLLVGRELQVMLGQRPQQCFLMPILVGTDGVQKMSKSLGNYIGVEEPPNDMYGKLMSLPDGLIVPYFEYLTDIPDEELAAMSQGLAYQEVPLPNLVTDEGEPTYTKVNPMLLKKRLAGEITAQFHGSEAADAAQEQFEKVIQLRDIPGDISEFPLAQFYSDEGELLSWSRVLVDAHLASSTSQAKRLIAQGAVDIISASGEARTLASDGRPDDTGPGDVIRVGKRRFVRLVEG
jgi:tyrosyl-tRNA synthetase